MEKKKMKHKEDFNMENFIFNRHGLKTFYLKQFREDAKNLFRVWKKEDGCYLLAKYVLSFNGRMYAEETVPFGSDNSGARKACDELRREYILNKVRDLRTNKAIY